MPEKQGKTKHARHHRPKHRCACGVRTHSGNNFSRHTAAHPDHRVVRA